MAIKSYADNIILVELPPEPEIRKELDTLMEILNAGNGCDVVLDFTHVTILTSMALSGFLQLRKLMEKSDRKLIFCNASPITKDIFKVTCFDGIFEFINDKTEALKTLTSQQQCSQTTN
jgi:anti-anti-sigma factor